MSELVSTEWLASRLSAPDIVILDASWHMPAAKRDARAEFAKAHIPGALFFDLDANSDTSSTLPHMLPSPAKFASDMKKLGVGDGKKVVCYDTAGLFSSARCWWMFKSFGHDDVVVLDGGFPKWLRERRHVTEGPAARLQQRHFTPRFRATMVRSLPAVATALVEGSAQVADARSSARFRGDEPDPRPGVRPGHMPGARNVHYASLLNADGTLKTGDALRRAFTDAGIDLDRPVITSCGSGVTAAILSLGLSELGVKDHALYDGSWAEWGASTEQTAAGPA